MYSLVYRRNDEIPVHTVLVREFESRRGEMLNLFAKKKKKDQQLLRAPSVWASTIRRESPREELKSSREKNARHEPQWVGGKSLLCDSGSELRLGGRENRRAKIINGMEKNKQKTVRFPPRQANTDT